MIHQTARMAKRQRRSSVPQRTGRTSFGIIGAGFQPRCTLTIFVGLRTGSIKVATGVCGSPSYHHHLHCIGLLICWGWDHIRPIPGCAFVPGGARPKRPVDSQPGPNGWAVRSSKQLPSGVSNVVASQLASPWWWTLGMYHVKLIFIHDFQTYDSTSFVVLSCSTFRFWGHSFGALRSWTQHPVEQLICDQLHIDDARPIMTVFQTQLLQRFRFTIP